MSTDSQTAHLAVGVAAPARNFGPITITDIVRYAGASGDFNRIHHDDAYAKAAGYPTVFSIGMLQAGLLATFATDWLGPEHVREFKARFRDQVWPGDELTCTGEITAISDADGERRIEVALVCTRQNGNVAIDGSAVFAL